MKKLILSLVIVLTTNTFFAQSVFDKFDGLDDVTTVIVNKKMFALLSKMDVKDKETQQYVNLIKKLDNLKVFVTQSDKRSDEMKAVADKYIKSSALEELMRMNEKGKSVKIYVKSGASDSQIKELLMFVEGGKTVRIGRVVNATTNKIESISKKTKAVIK